MSPNLYYYFTLQQYHSIFGLDALTSYTLIDLCKVMVLSLVESSPSVIKIFRSCVPIRRICQVMQLTVI